VVIIALNGKQIKLYDIFLYKNVSFMGLILKKIAI